MTLPVGEKPAIITMKASDDKKEVTEEKPTKHRYPWWTSRYIFTKLFVAIFTLITLVALLVLIFLERAPESVAILSGLVGLGLGFFINPEPDTKDGSTTNNS